MRVVKTLSLFAGVLTMLFLMEATAFAVSISFNYPHPAAPISASETYFKATIMKEPTEPSLGTVNVFIIAEETIPKGWSDRERYWGAVHVSGEKTPLYSLPIKAPNNQKCYFKMRVELRKIDGTDRVIAQATHAGFTLNRPVGMNVTVWPGDTDNDGVVGTADVLPIGTYWGCKPMVRSNASTQWTGQMATVGDTYSPYWSHADAGGNGKVDANDVLLIGLNWGKARPLP